ncbi:MAG: hypothetical protein COA44_15830 [Arcobacter sp.]|nr:MAG: hypothetical protein COA44_15830 [Arcobacter sp.]
MQNNVFLVSDASYSNMSKIAGLGVVNLNSGQEYTSSKAHITSIYHAEWYALLYSIHIALENKLDNVIFIYDHSSLKLCAIKKYLKDKISCFQFLWLKRVYVHKADRVAYKARALREKLLCASSPKAKFTPMKGELSDEELFKSFQAKALLIQFHICSLMTDPTNKEIIYHYLNHTHPKKLYSDEKLNYRFLNFIYYLLPEKDRTQFFQYLSTLVTHSLNKKKFKSFKKKALYLLLLKETLFVFKQQTCTSKEITC